MYRPIISLKEGKVRGTSVAGVLGSTYVAFHEIPFAAPPIGQLRFKDPRPPASWTGIKNCTVCTKKMCTQALPDPPYNSIGTEDCLYLNVYTNSIKQSKPVIFWIHGGKFTVWGSCFAQIRPDYLLAKDVVVVAANYRLGAFGFLNLGHPAAPGNQGLKDLIAALQWVKENIAKFGGDPNNVTLIGESAGAVLAHALTISPKTQGLFHKTILQSGMLTSSWGFGQSRPQRYFKLASVLGIKSTDPVEVVEMLRNISDKDIVGAYSSILTREEADLFDIPFGVNYDDIADDPVLPFPIEQLHSNDINIPIMTGYTSNECIMFVDDTEEETIEYCNINLPDLVKIIGQLRKLGPAEFQELLTAVKNQHFNGQPITSDKIEIFIRFITYVLFVAPLKLYIKDRLERTSTPSYIYRFSYVGTESTIIDVQLKRIINEACHMDDLSYLFYLPICKNDNPDPPAIGTKDRNILERLTTMWTNFARTGNPTPSYNDFVKVHWKPATKDNLYCLEIDEESELTELEVFNFE
ncbi:esterase FE4-like [Colletes gigas]|uniref:esterase FE4-like n=1 Tax=Colletes gigas TaxID=935657 RepID=UPI001C9B110A|nr:esterase FE4-like [Colletes gigas]